MRIRLGTVSPVLSGFLFATLFGTGFAFGQSDSRSPVAQSVGKVLVTVNGEPITEGDLEFLYLSRRIPENVRPTIRKQFIDLLIDQRLMQAFLSQRKATAEPAQVQSLVERIHAIIGRGGNEPGKVLAELGYDEARLRRELALPLAWQTHVDRIVTGQQMRAYWEKHRFELDGTEVRASQILIKLSADAAPEEFEQAEKKLQALREDIVAGRTTFAEAARQHSEAPSSENGGDLGVFPYRGRMPVVYSQAAFPLKKGEVSQPFRSQFGVHLVTITDRRPGQLSLEDVRPQVQHEIARQVWDDLVKREREKARIVWQEEP
jgi:hypothetical protein